MKMSHQESPETAERLPVEPSTRTGEHIRATVYANLRKALTESGTMTIRVADENVDDVLQEVAAIDRKDLPGRIVLRADKDSEAARRLQEVRSVNGMQAQRVVRNPEDTLNERDSEELRHDRDAQAWRLGAGGFAAMEDALLNAERALRSVERRTGLRLKVTDKTLGAMSNDDLVRLGTLLDRHQRTIHADAYTDIRSRMLSMSAERTLRSAPKMLSKSTPIEPNVPPAESKGKSTMLGRFVQSVTKRFSRAALMEKPRSKIRVGVLGETEADGKRRAFGSVEAMKRHEKSAGVR